VSEELLVGHLRDCGLFSYGPFLGSLPQPLAPLGRLLFNPHEALPAFPGLSRFCSCTRQPLLGRVAFRLALQQAGLDLPVVSLEGLVPELHSANLIAVLIHLYLLSELRLQLLDLTLLRRLHACQLA